MGVEPVIFLIWEGFIQGDPLSMVLYWITLAPLAEELCAAAPAFLPSFYTDDAAFYGLADKSARLMTLLLEQGAEMGYFPGPYKLLLICDSPLQE